MPPPQLYKVSKAAEILGISKEVLRKWDNEGKVNAIRTPGGMRLYDITEINTSLVSKQKNKACEGTSVIIYARVSSAKQKDDLERQKKYLQSNIPDKYKGCRIVEVSDIGSGINFRRPGLLRILGSVKEGNVSGVVVASRDRLARFGYELVDWMCKEFGTEIVVLDNEDTTPEEELGKDLMSIVQVYCCRWNGKRRYQRKDKADQDVQAKAETDSESESDAEAVVRVPKVHLQQSHSTTSKATKHDKKQNIAPKQVRRKQNKDNEED
jgi:putative resolvase